MKHLTAYMVFAALYGGLQLAAVVALDRPGSEAFAAAAGWAMPFAAAPLALLAAARFGRLTRPGVAVASVGLALLVCCMTVAVSFAVAIPALGGPDPGHLGGMFVSYFTIGGWRLLLGLVLFVAAPLLWATWLPGLEASRAPAAA